MFWTKIKEFLSSKKWYMTILGSCLVYVANHFGLPDIVTSLIAGLFGTYVVGQGIADINKKPTA